MPPSTPRSALALALLVCAGAAAAQPYDPAFRWRTIETARFRIHYHQGEEALAQEIARVAERARAALAPLLGNDPPRTEVVLSDDVDDANGSATPLPYDTIRLYAVPPTSLSELNGYRDWVEALFFHEYVHILHLDNVGGVPAAANAVFGKLFTPNGLVPLWMIEGLAVSHESGGNPTTGRNASAIHEMYARALAVEPPGFPRLDEVSNPFLGWPSGDIPYLVGGRFMVWLEARYGEAAMRGYLARQGSWIWPYAPSWVAGPFFGGQTFAALWDEYGAYERARADEVLAAVRARPVTRPRRLTFMGGRAERPRWSRDGAFLAYWRSTLDRPPGLFRVSPDGRDLGRVTTIDQNGTFAMQSPEEAIVAIGDVFHEFRVYDDLYRVNLATRRRERLTDGERATDPDVAPGGGAIVYVRRSGPGRLALVRRTLDAQGRLGARELLLERPGAQVFMPRVSPDGRRVAFELHEGGRRDIALLEDGRVTRVTDDPALDLGPAWTPDGRFLIFASDRGGVFNLYAWEAATGAIRQVTNVEFGAFAPDVSPDGRTIAFLTYSRAGYDLATIPLDPATWIEPLAGDAPRNSFAAAVATRTTIATSTATPTVTAT
ncbi:MAG TPA: hypothetical protein VM753_00605, partial [Anaeromyxobacter sp.]|nr:hypothetical protein [Anaeromyxobacter sp.]